MKAWVLSEVGKFTYEEVSKPVLTEGEVLVRVKACGICGSDIPRVYRDGAHKMPLIIGHEFSGEVVECGAGTKKNWLGKRVGTFPLIPCGKCIPCQKRQYEMCRNYSYLGSRKNGGFAEYVAVPEQNLIAIPEGVSYEATAMLEPMAVAVHAIRKVKPKEQETVVVWGFGTIGALLAMFLRERGIKNLYVVGNKESQRELARKLGIDEEHYCDSTKKDAVLELLRRTDGIGADVVFDAVGREEVYSGGIEVTAPGGRVCLLGNPYGDMSLSQKVYWKILRNQITLIGTWNSSFLQEEDDDWHYVIEKLSSGRIQPEQLITHRYSLEDISRGFEIMRDKSEDYTKIMTRVEC